MNKDKSIIYEYFKLFTEEENLLKLFEKNNAGCADNICLLCYESIDKSEIERLKCKLNIETGDALKKTQNEIIALIKKCKYKMYNRSTSNLVKHLKTNI